MDVNFNQISADIQLFQRILIFADLPFEFQILLGILYLLISRSLLPFLEA